MSFLHSCKSEAQGRRYFTELHLLIIDIYTLYLYKGALTDHHTGVMVCFRDQPKTDHTVIVRVKGLTYTFLMSSSTVLKFVYNIIV